MVESAEVLVISDDMRVIAALRRGFHREGHRADIALDDTEGLRSAQEGGFDAIVVEAARPAVEGLEHCRQLRHNGIWTPVLMMLAVGDESVDERGALASGADDVLLKPFSHAILASRLAGLGIEGSGPGGHVELGDLRIDRRSRRCWRAGTSIQLPDREYSVLEYLVRNHGRVVTKQELLEHVWSYDFTGPANIVEVFVGQLRRKIDKPFGCQSIRTLRGAGYMMSDHSTARTGPT